MGAARSSKQLCASHHSSTAIMSDEEFYEEEEVSNTSKKGDGNFLKARQEAKKGELDEQLREYINEWRRNKCGTTDSQEELPNHQKNCSLYSQLSPFDCALRNKYFVFILSLRFQLKLKQISIAYLRDVCNHINCLRVLPF